MGSSLTVLSAGAIRRAVTQVVRTFEAANDCTVALDFTSAPKVRARVLAGDPADVVIASDRALDVLAKESKIAPASRVVVGRSRMAVVMRSGAAQPDLSGTEAFRQSLLAADGVVYNEGSSGAHAAAIVEKLGLRGVMGAKVRVVQNGAEMMDCITSQAGLVLGLAQVTNVLDQIAKGIPVVLAGLFPDEIQNVTLYEAAVGAGSCNPQLAGALVRGFASAEAMGILKDAGLD